MPRFIISLGRPLRPPTCRMTALPRRQRPAFLFLECVMSFVTSSAARPDLAVRALVRRPRGISLLLAALASVLIAGTAIAQSGVIAGTVVSAGSGVGIPAVTVLVPGTTTGTTSLANYRFRLGCLSGP